MTKAAFVKRDNALWPMDQDGRDLLAAMPEDKKVMVHVHAARNVTHHRLLFFLMEKIIKGGAWEGDADTLLDYLKIGTHHVRTVVGPDGKTYYIPKSIAFESMPQDEFRRWFDRVIWLICERLLGGHNQESLKAEIIEAVERDTRSLEQHRRAA